MRRLADSPAEIEISALAWYEFCRGPRSPEQEAVARSFSESDGIVPFDEDWAAKAADLLRRLGSPATARVRPGHRRNRARAQRSP